MQKDKERFVAYVLTLKGKERDASGRPFGDVVFNVLRPVGCKEVVARFGVEEYSTLCAAHMKGAVVTFLGELNGAELTGIEGLARV